MYGAGVGGMARITVDGVVGKSGSPTRVYFAEVQSGGVAAVVILRNGTGTGSDALSQINGTISQGVSRYYGANGLLFPAGCFCDVDANTTYVSIAYTQETT